MTVNVIRFGDHAVVSNSQLVAGIVRESFNTVEKMPAGELRKNLEDLHAAVVELSEKLPTDEAKQDVANSLKTLTSEVNRPQPRREWYDVSAKGLMDATRAVADMAPRIVALLAAIGKRAFPS